ncbi:MAG: hypothetical protein WCF84_09780 [Anaerolineae bacterium]
MLDHDEAIRRARDAAPQSSPEIGIQEARVDTITAELITLAEADRRFGENRGPNGYAPGQTPQSLVWWVAVRGYFKYEGMAAAGDAQAPVYEANQRIFTYDATTGEEIQSSIGPDRLASPSLPPLLPTPAAPSAGAGLTVEEYPIVSSQVDTPDHLEYNQLIPTEVRQRHIRDRNLPPDARVESTNIVLAKYGYLLQHDPPRSSYVYLLYKDDRLILDEITGFRPISENANRDDFALYLYSDKNGDQLLRKNGMQEWKPENPSTTLPVLFGNDLIAATWQDSLFPPYGWVVVKRGDQTLYSIPSQFEAENPIHGLWAWEGHWVLEVDGKLIIEGENQNEVLGNDEIFEWHLIHSKPFYFLKKGGNIRISYAGETLPYQYDEVIHYRCCEPAAFNPGATENMIWFHAHKGTMWYYVEAGVYE